PPPGERGSLPAEALAKVGVRGQSVETAPSTLFRSPTGLTVISIVGVNGTGKTTTGAKLAKFLQDQNHPAVLAACDTFRAAAIEQIKLWGERLDIPVIAGDYGADPAAVAHDAIAAAESRGAHYLLVDT